MLQCYDQCWVAQLRTAQAVLPPSHRSWGIKTTGHWKPKWTLNTQANPEKYPATESRDYAKFVRCLRKYLNTNTENNGDLGKAREAIKSFIITTGINSLMTVGSGSYVIFSDNLDKKLGIRVLKDESVALTFTSPPYWNFVDYAGSEGVGYEDSYKEYLNSLLKLFRAIGRKTMPGGRMVVNASNMKSRKSVEGESFVYPIVPDIIGLAKRAGFTFFDEIIWVKGGANAGALKGRVLFGSYPYPPTPKILDSTFENIVVFTKPGKREKVDKEVKNRSQLTKDEWRDFTKGIWEIPPDRNPDHPATFPMEIAERIVRMYSFADDVVLDPFAGSGTTLIAADKHNRRGIGFEIARDYEQAIKNKEAECLRQLHLPLTK